MTTRGDLVIVLGVGGPDATRDATDADLAAMGYVKLDVDVAELRQSLNEIARFGSDMMLSAVVDVAEQVLAALDGETT